MSPEPSRNHLHPCRSIQEHQGLSSTEKASAEVRSRFRLGAFHRRLRCRTQRITWQCSVDRSTHFRNLRQGPRDVGLSHISLFPLSQLPHRSTSCPDCPPPQAQRARQHDTTRYRAVARRGVCLQKLRVRRRKWREEQETSLGTVRRRRGEERSASSALSCEWLHVLFVSHSRP